MRVLFILFLLPCFCFGQDTEADIPKDKRSVIKVQPLLSPEFGIETRLTGALTLYNHIGLGWGVTLTDGSIDRVLLIPIYHVDLRAYHSLKKRREKGKRTDGFSGNYIQFHNAVSTDHLQSGTWISLVAIYSGIHYGLQRRLSKHLYFDGNIGAGYSSLVGFTPDIELSLGYSFL